MSRLEFLWKFNVVKAFHDIRWWQRAVSELLIACVRAPACTGGGDLVLACRMWSVSLVGFCRSLRTPEGSPRGDETPVLSRPLPTV